MIIDDIITGMPGTALNYHGASTDPRVRKYIPPVRIVYSSDDELKPVNSAILLETMEIQCYIHYAAQPCVMRPGASLLLDFGVELNGGIRIVSSSRGRVRVRFGESVSEAMGTPVNDHAMHDTMFDLAPMSHNEIGNTGFRFVRIDVPADLDHNLELFNIQAVAIFRDLPYAGSFNSSDERLNRIWKTGAYTVHLNMQDYLYDGVKRDRLVWMGDMHPEIRTAAAVFADVDCINSSLDYIRDRTPEHQFMNGISSYSMWWIISHYDWYMARGNFEYLRSQHDRVRSIVNHLGEYIGANGSEQFDGRRFLDWPSNDNEPVKHAGLHALMIWAFTAAEKICRLLNDEATARLCAGNVQRMKAYCPDPAQGKQAGALMAISGLCDPVEINRDVLAVNPYSGISTFYGYYVLQARALAGDHAGALEVIRRYWGGMLDFGATSFWEDFDLDWTRNAFRIDELPVAGKKDIHADFGNYCYNSLRHSLCHGWAGGPTAWLSEHLLGITPIEPGFKTAMVKPCLAGLDWLNGTVPTPYGVIEVSAERSSDGSFDFKVNAPDEVKIVRMK